MTHAFCTECGTRLDAGARFCANCGTAVQRSTAEAEPRPLPAHEPPVPAPVHEAVVTAAAARSELPFAAAATQTVIHNTVAMAVPGKSVGVAFALAFFFGPLGMLYATVGGAVTMFFVSLVVALITVGFGLLITWPICIIWACMATNSYNATLLASRQGISTS
jgi:hypothetical protein